jgi:menaquinone-dependent protoporphyrinogen oxidase
MRVLVVADGRHGATEEIAGVIAEALERRGLGAELRGPADVTSLDGYDAVVAGSAIYVGRWVGSMRSFARRLEPELLGLPVWLFSSGPLDDSSLAEGTSSEPAELTTRLRARGHALFAGRLDLADLNWGERLVAKAVKAPTGDFRDWTEIEEWAAGIATELSTPPVTTTSDG